LRLCRATCLHMWLDARQGRWLVSEYDRYEHRLPGPKSAVVLRSLLQGVAQQSGPCSTFVSCCLKQGTQHSVTLMHRRPSLCPEGGLAPKFAQPQFSLTHHLGFCHANVLAAATCVSALSNTQSQNIHADVHFSSRSVTCLIAASALACLTPRQAATQSPSSKKPAVPSAVFERGSWFGSGINPGKIRITIMIRLWRTLRNTLEDGK
jgi:hypothetical protein